MKQACCFSKSLSAEELVFILNFSPCFLIFMANKNLRERIEKLSVSALAVLQDAGIDDTELLTLTREDLHELFPGVKNFQLRRKIMEMISEATQELPRPSSSTLINALKDFIQRNDRGGPAAEGLFREYLCALRDLEKHFTAALDFLKPHIELLENLSQVPIRQEATGSEKTHEHFRSKGLTHAAPPSTPVSLPVKIHSLVCGNTLGAHKSILTHLQPVEESSVTDCRIILAFCPIATRPGTDIEAAIQKVPGAKATILVVMHHTRDQDHIGVNPRIFAPNTNIVECVNVVFHESVPGLLLTCNANMQAIAQIKATLERFM